MNEACANIDFQSKSKTTVTTIGKYIYTNYFSILQSVTGIVVNTLRAFSNSCSLTLARTADGGVRQLLHEGGRAPTLGSAQVPLVRRFAARYICAMRLHFVPLEGSSPRTVSNLDICLPWLGVKVNCSLTTLWILLQIEVCPAEIPKTYFSWQSRLLPFYYSSVPKLPSLKL